MTRVRARLVWWRAVVSAHLLNDRVWPWNWRIVQRFAAWLGRFLNV